MFADVLQGLGASLTPLIRRPAFAVTLRNGAASPDLQSAIVAVSVDLQMDDPSAFTLEVDDPDLKWMAAPGGAFVEGAEIDVALGYVGAMTRLITGKVSAVGAEIAEGGGLSLQVEGFDALHDASRGTMEFDYAQGMTDSAIFADVVLKKLNRPQASVTSTPPRNRPRSEKNISALEFIRMLARDNGFSFWCDGEVLNFHPTRTGPVVVLRRRSNLVSFDARINLSGRVSEVEVLGADEDGNRLGAVATLADLPALAATLSATGRETLNPGGKASRRVSTQLANVRSTDEAKRLAQALLLAQARHLVSGHASTAGDPTIVPGTRIQVVDMGRLDGTYVVESARHRLDGNGYLTSFGFRLDL